MKPACLRSSPSTCIAIAAFRKRQGFGERCRDDWIRTSDPTPPRRVLYRTELHPAVSVGSLRFAALGLQTCYCHLATAAGDCGLPTVHVGYTGFEPVTSCLSSMRSKPTELIPLFKDRIAKLRTRFKPRAQFSLISPCALSSSAAYVIIRHLSATGI